MGGLSIWHWLVVGIIVLLLFGKGRFSDMMGDVAKGIKSFKKGMSEEDEAGKAKSPAQLEAEAARDRPIDLTPQSTRDPEDGGAR